MRVHQFWWVWSLRFRRYGYLSKTAKFPFRPMDYSPWSSKKLIDRNQLKKFMQVGIDVTCMYTSFGGCGLSGFGDMATLQKRPNFPFDPWTMHVCMCTQSVAITLTEKSHKYTQTNTKTYQ